MGKNKCCKKSSSSKCDDYSSSSTSCSLYSSSTYGFCCPKYPKCGCVVNKCAPIYYPNNCVGQYPCNPCPPNPCPPYPCPPYPCPPYPCPPTQCGVKFTTSGSTTSSTNLTATSPNVNIYSTIQTIQLPAITSLSSCGYTKMFILSNLSTSTGSLTINTGTSTFGQDLFTNNGTNTYTLTVGQTLTIYSVYVPNATSYWVFA